MTLMQSPEIIMLIHRTMVSEQIERRAAGVAVRSSVIGTIRSIVGGTLIALGQHVIPPARQDRMGPAAGRIAIARHA